MTETRLKLKSLEIKGFKSIPSTGQRVAVGDVTILLGANGSGKSNLISFFKMLNVLPGKGLQVFIGKQGGADALLYYGSKHTDKIEFVVSMEIVGTSDLRCMDYVGKLVHGMPDRLFFASERLTFSPPDKSTKEGLLVGTANGESVLGDSDLNDIHYKSQESLFTALSSVRVYQFHDTSDTAKIKSNGYIDDSRYLRSDAGNLAAFLLAMQDEPAHKKYYDRIIRHIQKVMPQFKGFELEHSSDNKKTIQLNWRDTTGETLFGPHQLSDGSLRFMALTAVFLQPVVMLPNVIVVDEPELGLHPAAIAELAGMIKIASKNAQIIIATQSTRLIDEFNAGEIVVVERDETNHCSVFKQLDEKKLDDWLSRYSLSELWEKNVLGGRP